MAKDDLYSETVFQSLDNEEAFDSPPVSKTALAAGLLGLASLVVLLAPQAVIVSFAAMGLGAAATWLSRKSLGSLSGWFATMGMALGLLTAVWSIVAEQNKRDYLFDQAAEQAAHFLDVLGQGKIYEAAELTQQEPNRQITGIDLESYYKGLGEEDGAAARSFVSDPLVLAVVKAGPDADWQYSRPIELFPSRAIDDLTVEFVSRAQPDLDPVQVKMRRTVGLIYGDEGANTALWNVVYIVDPK